MSFLEDLNRARPVMCAISLRDLCDFISGESLGLSKSHDLDSKGFFLFPSVSFKTLPISLVVF